MTDYNVKVKAVNSDGTVELWVDVGVGILSNLAAHVIVAAAKAPTASVGDVLVMHVDEDITFTTP